MFNKTRKGNPLPFSGKGKQANVDEGDVKHDGIEHENELIQKINSLSY